MFKNLVSQHCPQNSDSNLFWDTLYVMKSTCYLPQKNRISMPKMGQHFHICLYSGPMGLTVKRPFFFTTSLCFCCCSVHKPNKHPGTLTIYGLHTVRLATFANSAQNSSSWKGVCWWVASMKYIFVCKPHKIFGVALMEYRNLLRKMRWEKCPWKMVRIVGWLCWCSEMRSCTCRG